MAAAREAVDGITMGAEWRGLNRGKGRAESADILSILRSAADQAPRYP